MKTKIICHNFVQLPCSNQFSWKGLNKMANILQTTFSNTSLFERNALYFYSNFCSLFLRVQLTISHHWFRSWIGTKQGTSHYLAPVPLSIFRSNSKFDENSKHSSVKYTRPITTIFCTRHDSVTVVTCAKYRCDRSSIFQTRAFWIFIEFRIRSKYA